MKMTICSVLDAKADMFGRPFFVQTTAVGLRSFNDEVNRNAPDNPFFTHPEDYALYELGIFDDQTGRIFPYEIPKLIIQAQQCALANNNREVTTNA